LRFWAFALLGEAMSKKDTISLHSVLKKYELNERQKVAVEAIKNNKLTVLYGKAGTAKTFTAVYAAMKLLAQPTTDIKKIYLSRPLVTTEKLGFLPGDLNDKIDPFLQPLITFFNKFGDSGAKTFESLVTGDKIQRLPVALMRGQTIEDGVLIVDEAQNLTAHQMLMILTRMGQTGKIVISGDFEQNDTLETVTGLEHVLKLAEKLPYIQTIEMVENMRDPIVTEIIDTWEEIAV